MGDNEVELFLNHLVNQQNVTPNTQTQALNALSFLFKEVIKKPLSLSLGFIKSKRATKLPVVLTQQEINNFLKCALQSIIYPVDYFMAVVCD